MKNLGLKIFAIILISFSAINCSEDKKENLPNLLTLTTETVSNISYTSATAGGNITNDGGASVTSRGVVWSTAPNPSSVLPTRTTNGSGIGAFSSSLTDLTPNTLYYLRAYATNSEGTGYGNEISFTTQAATVPTVTTQSIITTSLTGASSGGNITHEGGGSIISKGITWGLNPNPTVEADLKTNDGTGLGSFTSDITNLTYGTTYYVRAYASNNVGTSYGNETSFIAGAPFNELDKALQSKIDQYNIPGLSVAIIKNEKLVYVKSYGYADKEAGQVATNNNLYRIASNSKPITLIAILKLVEDGIITTDQRVFGPVGILGSDFGSIQTGSNKDKITIRHLIEHKSGWTNTPNDPMFLDVSLTQSQIISEVLINRPLTYVPGETYFYSNFGYSLLGRVIEKVTGKTYENYVKEAILKPMGIAEMRIGGNTLNQRFPNEVKYYQNEFSPYAMNVTRMDSHGGWIASAADMAKFMVRVDRNPSVPDILPNALLKQFYFGFNNWTFYGSLPGTSSILNRLNDTYSFVVHVNTRTQGDVSLILNDLNSTVINQINSRASWPTYDLF